MKKLIKSVIILFLCLLSTLQTFAQNTVNLNTIQAAVKNTNDNIPKSGVKGTPYANEEFELVKLSLVNIKNQIFQARYNAFNGDMEVKSNGQAIILDSSKDIEVLFTNKNKLYKTATFRNKNLETERGFLMVLSQSDSLSIYKQESIRFVEEKASTTGYDKKQPAKFVKDSDTYYLGDNNEIKYLPNNKKDFLKAFPEKSSKLKSYMKDKKLNPKNEEDLIVLVKYLSSISS